MSLSLTIPFSLQNPSTLAVPDNLSANPRSLPLLSLFSFSYSFLSKGLSVMKKLKSSSYINLWMRRVRVKIEGVVQGVFFRANVEKLANELGVKGYVKNVESHVEAVFEGEDGKVGEVLAFCAVGPEGAKVKNIILLEESYQSEFDSFSVLY